MEYIDTDFLFLNDYEERGRIDFLAYVKSYVIFDTTFDTSSFLYEAYQNKILYLYTILYNIYIYDADYITKLLIILCR